MSEQGDHPELELDPRVEHLVPDPRKSPPEAVVLHGYPGRGTTDDVRRLYLTAELDRYVEFPSTAVLHSEKHPDAGTLVWLPGGLRLTVCRVEEAQIYAEFLAGSITRARLRDTIREAGAAALRLQAAAAYRPTRKYTCHGPHCGGHHARPPGDELSALDFDE